MPDMLVRLATLPPLDEAIAAMAGAGVCIRRALAPEKPVLLAWVGAHFPVWQAEVEVACARLPIACFIAVRDGSLAGFACHDVICRNFFGPAAVDEIARGQGIGRALLLAALHAQRADGYAYAIIGGVGPEAFYVRCVGATLIADSAPGIYAGMLRAG
ncbi:MAG: GNAT family N-acetyltransferase [Casimicrobiaceae bacterium]